MKKEKRALFYSSVNDKDLFVTMGFYSTDIQILQDLGLTVYLTNSFMDFLKFWQYDIAFIYFWTKGLVPAIISKIFRKKVIFTGGTDSLDSGYNKSINDFNLKKIIFKLCAFCSDANIIVSRSDLKNIEAGGYNLKRLYLIPHVIDFEKYAYNGTPKKNIMVTIVWMGTIGNVQRKGVDKLLHIFTEFIKKNDDFKVVIIGCPGQGTDYLKNIARKMNVENKIIFTGRIDEQEKIKYLQDCKYYFQLSEYEGFGIGAIEALAAGDIVIHSGRGGLADGIDSFGVLIKNIDDYKNIALQLENINKNYENYNDFVRKGIKHVEEKFSYHVRKEGIAKIISEIFI
jgi:glycosyltransferase involved in cell wall biosynthesis